MSVRRVHLWPFTTVGGTVQLAVFGRVQVSTQALQRFSRRSGSERALLRAVRLRDFRSRFDVSAIVGFATVRSVYAEALVMAVIEESIVSRRRQSYATHRQGGW